LARDRVTVATAPALRVVYDGMQIDLASHGVSQAKPSLQFIQTAELEGGQNPNTLYQCQFWLSDDKKTIIATCRVDSE